MSAPSMFSIGNIENDILRQSMRDQEYRYGLLLGAIAQAYGKNGVLTINRSALVQSRGCSITSGPSMDSTVIIAIG